MNGEGERLPLDPDRGAGSPTTGASRPVHLRWNSLALVFIGGSLGTAAREAISLAFPPIDGVPYAIFGINVAGALLLGFLIEALVRHGRGTPGALRLRLLLGTGLLGGFTTYSALASDAASLIGAGSTGPGIAYATATVLVGALATWTGIALAAGGRARSTRRHA